ncbi:MAG: hypothetical protein H6R16_2505 [Proteobacteria bacterium]|nr:hypothetical protein [Pseudomonadota bacterium]
MTEYVVHYAIRKLKPGKMVHCISQPRTAFYIVKNETQYIVFEMKNIVLCLI